MKRLFSLILLILIVIGVNAKTKDYNLKHWQEGKSPLEIGTRISEKFLNSRHSLYGNIHPQTPANVVAPTGAPLVGQVIVDPTNPLWLARNEDTDGDGRKDRFFICGPGDPEGFLYRGSRNSDGTRKGDQEDIIHAMIGTGANSLYFQAIRSHGGDGDSNPKVNSPDKYFADLTPGYENPFVNGNKDGKIDMDILDQWEQWFTLMDNNGIVVFLFFYDDNIKVGGSSSLGWPMIGGKLHEQEKYYLRTLVNRFEHHKNLVWCVMEEVEEMGTDYVAHASAIAEYVRQQDDHNHVIAAHQLNGTKFWFPTDPNIDMFALQTPQMYTDDTLHNYVKEGRQNAQGRYCVTMAENFDQWSDLRGSARHSLDHIRRRSWAAAMGGACAVLVYTWDYPILDTTVLRQCGYLRRFFEATEFTEMASNDELAYGGTVYVLARPGQSYIAYASDLSGEIGLKNMAVGTYTFDWFDCATGRTVTQTDVSVAAGNNTWSKPVGFGADVAVYIRKTNGTDKTVR